MVVRYQIIIKGSRQYPFNLLGTLKYHNVDVKKQTSAFLHNTNLLLRLHELIKETDRLNQPMTEILLIRFLVHQLED